MADKAGEQTAAENFRWAWALVDGLVQCGVTRFVISPGSRSTPLVLAIHRHPQAVDWVIADERSAAFFALGLSKTDGAPTAVVCTSGSAMANWHPAVMEADAGKVPLILLSADRPPEHLDIGANQTTDQIKLFASHVRAFHALPPPDGSIGTLAGLAARMTDRAVWPLPGPVHLNIPFREPLVPVSSLPEPPETLPAPPCAHHPVATPSPRTIDSLFDAINGKPGVIVCGWDTYPPGFFDTLIRLAEAAGAPVLADPLSGLRRGGWVSERVLTRYDAFLRAPAFADMKPAWILRFGAAPVSKTLMNWISADGIHSRVVVESHGRRSDPTACATDIVHANPDELANALAIRLSRAATDEWIKSFITAEQQCDSLAKGMPNDDADGIFEDQVIAALDARLSPDATLFVGNSMPVRDLDTCLGRGERPLKVLGNRGVSGIDGGVSTALGVAANSTGPVVGILGDLSFAHDIGGLQSMKDTPALFIVFNNGGGGIFEHLPQAGLGQKVFERYWLTPAAPDIGPICAAYGVGHAQVNNLEELGLALDDAFTEKGVISPGKVIEVMIDRTASTARRRAYWAAAAEET
ncbi:MAG: 2-succinyl-5-enolpyruvyl-6-hydroxy-3-cyclohexene-1-carboxylic-acid synthase [Rhodospirillales bacterium]|nr:2-succinyl-5-enolpyruvyl-6-hydroxy-3-cyclohexene-1-carboxylic-acid synthase [Rhodospirillales bacterium]